MIALPLTNRSLELWAGVECTVNRVGDEFFDQIERGGHAHRPRDLDLFAALGVRALRYPVLWERTAPDGPDGADWSWADQRLQRLRVLGVRPIVGLVHHGSGPRHTSLVDPAFPAGLATYAGAVARRYPWVAAYTPVNEPLTTARFSGLYGHWYPHGRDDATFARALLTQCRATVLAMRAIRAINPAAELVQTDDLGKTFSTPALAYQAEFNNERRWLTFDLLCGRVDRHHPMWGYLRWAGVGEGDLAWFLDNPCPPDVIGLNYYLTSERYLDERLARYAPDVRPGEAPPYADVELVRVSGGGPLGWRVLLREAWERYGLPLAVTEMHLGCSREEQLRWLKEGWDDATDLRRDGVDLRAVTIWALLGAYDWDSLVTRAAGRYEPGVFDLRGGRPRPTALARMARALATRGDYDHPVLATPGWWRRPMRLLYPPVEHEPGVGPPRRARPRPLLPAPMILITGAAGALGRAFARLCDFRGLAHHPLTRRELDIADPVAVAAVLDTLRPWAVVNAAGYARVDEAEREPTLCQRENTDGPAVLAAACARRGLALVTLSSDLVFDGRRQTPYTERHAVNPLGVYGRGKAEAEARVLAACPGALVIRTGALFGPWDAPDFLAAALRALAAGRTVVAADDIVLSPTYAPDLVHAALDLLIDGERGIWHLANTGAVSWAELARRAAAAAGFDASRVEGHPARAHGLRAWRPAYSALGSERGQLLPALDDALARLIRESETMSDLRNGLSVVS